MPTVRCVLLQDDKMKTMIDCRLTVQNLHVLAAKIYNPFCQALQSHPLKIAHLHPHCNPK